MLSVNNSHMLTLVARNCASPITCVTSNELYPLSLYFVFRFLGCEAQKINIAFLVDGSATMRLTGGGNFNKSLEFVQSIIGEYDVSKEGPNVGFAVFSTEYHQVFSLGDFNNSADAIAAVNKAPFPNRSRQTGKALNYARHMMFPEKSTRRNVSNYLIFLTVGASYDFVKTPARKLRDKNVMIFGIGVGNDFDVKELEEITGDNGIQMNIASVSELEEVKKQLKKEICLCKY